MVVALRDKEMWETIMCGAASHAWRGGEHPRDYAALIFPRALAKRQHRTMATFSRQSDDRTRFGWVRVGADITPAAVEGWATAAFAVADCRSGGAVARSVDPRVRRAKVAPAAKWTQDAALAPHVHTLLRFVGLGRKAVRLGHEVIRYDVGDFFVRHCDTPETRPVEVLPAGRFVYEWDEDPETWQSVGTLLFILGRDDEEGGELRVWEQGLGVRYRKSAGVHSDNRLVYIPHGMPHEVTEVLNTVRFAAKVKVYTPPQRHVYELDSEESAD